MVVALAILAFGLGYAPVAALAAHQLGRKAHLPLLVGAFVPAVGGALVAGFGLFLAWTAVSGSVPPEDKARRLADGIGYAMWGTAGGIGACLVGLGLLAAVLMIVPPPVDPPGKTA